MTPSEAKHLFMGRYWRSLSLQFDTVAQMAEHAKVSKSYVYSMLSKYGLQTPQGKQ